MSEDMVKDGYEDIVNIDISSVAIDMMRRKYEFVPQLKCILVFNYERMRGKLLNILLLVLVILASCSVGYTCFCGFLDKP